MKKAGPCTADNDLCCACEEWRLPKLWIHWWIRLAPSQQIIICVVHVKSEDFQKLRIHWWRRLAPAEMKFGNLARNCMAPAWTLRKYSIRCFRLLVCLFSFFSLYFCSLRGNKLVSKVPNFISSQKLQGPLPCTRAKMAPKPSHFRSALPSVLAPPQVLCPIPRPDVWNPASFGLGLPCHSPCLLDHACNARVCPVQRLWWRDDGLWRPGPGPDWAGNCRRYCHEQGRRHRALHFTPHWLLQARKLRAGRCFLFLLLLCWI